MLWYKETTIKENLQGNVHIGYKAFAGKKNLYMSKDGSDQISRWQNLYQEHFKLISATLSKLIQWRIINIQVKECNNVCFLWAKVL